MADEYSLDTDGVRRAFARAAESYDSAAVLQREIADRLLGHLDFIKLQPQRILDLGCGTGRDIGLLAQRFPNAWIMGLDLAEPLLRKSRHRTRWRRSPRVVCGDAYALPVADGSVDFVYSNLMLQWCDDFERAIAEITRILRPNGLLLFSTFGPDTLHELREAWQAVDTHVHVNRFLDMHDIGDMLVQAGMQEPVMDTERITLSYEDMTSLAHDLKNIGASRVSAGRRRGLTGRGRFRRAARSYRKQTDGRLGATYEVVYGTAWMSPQPVGVRTNTQGVLPADALRTMLRKRDRKEHY